MVEREVISEQFPEAGLDGQLCFSHCAVQRGRSLLTRWEFPSVRNMRLEIFSNIVYAQK